MRKILLVCLFALVCGGLAQGQGADEIPCAAGSLEGFLNRRAEALDLGQRIEATAAVSELVALSADFINMITLLPFSASFCYEGYDTMWRLDQFLNDTYGAQLMRLLDVADQDNTYLQSLPTARQLVDNQAQALEALLESGEREGLTSTMLGSGGECYFEDMILPTQQWLAHEALMKRIQMTETLDDVLNVGSEVSAWREKTWSVVPACFESFLHLMERSQLAQFVSMGRALTFGGVSKEDDPFAETLDEMLNPPYRPFGRSFHEERLRVWNEPAPIVFGIPKCSLAELESFAHIPAEFDNLLAEAQSAVDTERQLAVIRRQVAWRHRLWMQMPMCREVLEMTWLMRQISSDQAAAFAVQLLSDRDSSAPLTARSFADVGGGQRLRQLRDQMDGYLTGADGDLPETAEAAFFTCGDQLTEDETDGITAGYRDALGQAREISSADHAVDFFENDFRWSAGYLASLPGCPEAIELGWLTSLWTTSEALSTVLTSAGLAPVDNPYIVEIELSVGRWFQLNQALRGGVPMPKEYGAPGAGRLRSCSDADASIIMNAEKTYDELLGYPRAFAIDEMVEYALTYLDWRDASFRDYPLCAEAHKIRLDFSQIVGDVIARRILDIDGRLYGESPWRQLPDDFVRYAKLGETLFAARLASGPPLDERVVPICTAEETETVAELAAGLVAIAQTRQSFVGRSELPAFHQQILDWREGLMARLPQCAGAVELGWLMNDLHIDLAVVGSLAYVGVNLDALPHADIIAENLSRLSIGAREFGIEI